MSEVLSLLKEVAGPTWAVLQFVIQVGLLAGCIYWALRYLRNTPGVMILAGLALVMVLAYTLAGFLRLEVIGWLLEKLPPLLALGTIIIFQPELRRIFAEIGSNPQRWRGTSPEKEEVIDALIRASLKLAKTKTGAIIAIEREIGMRPYAETGVSVRAPVSVELLMTIFHKDTPLHDGAVIVRQGMIDAASCFFPLTQTGLSRELGTRHRAAVGVTEQTDAVCVVVSEERGTVSIAYAGRLARDVDEQRLRRHLTNFLIKKAGNTTQTFMGR